MTTDIQSNLMYVQECMEHCSDRAMNSDDETAKNPDGVSSESSYETKIKTVILSPDRRPLLQRQTTRLGLTSDESVTMGVIGMTFEDCINTFLCRTIAPAAALILILISFSQIDPAFGFTNKIINTSTFVGCLTLLTWKVCEVLR